jgi:hypothetical protein
MSSTFRVGRYTCTMSLEGQGVKTTWTPRLPNDLKKKEVRAYRKGRDAFLAQATPGGRFVVVGF